jgi:hypothetical protein
MKPTLEGTLAFRKPRDTTTLFKQSGSPLRSDNPLDGKSKSVS